MRWELVGGGAAAAVRRAARRRMGGGADAVKAQGEEGSRGREHALTEGLPYGGDATGALQQRGETCSGQWAGQVSGGGVAAPA
nr:unnamed protein product [Digitaria exilis]